MGDDVGAHTSALGGLVAGIVAGAVAGVVLGAVVFATVATGGAALAVIGASVAAVGGTVSLAAIGGKIGKSFGATMPAASPCSKVIVGSPDTFIEDKKAARAEMDTASHGAPQRIAQGSSTVFVNDRMLARDTDSVRCGGRLVSHCQNVWIGGPPGGAPGSEVPWWASDHNLDLIATAGAGTAIMGSVLMVGAVTTGVLTASGWLAGKAGHLAGGLVGRGIDSLTGRTDQRWENLGAGLGEVGGGLAGAFGRPGRWQMAAANHVNGALGNNRILGASPGELYALKREGFGWSPEEGLSPKSRFYSERMHEAVRDVGGRVEAGELRTARDAMDALAGRRAEIAREMRDRDASDFGVRRDTPELIDSDALTPIRGNSRYGYVADRADHALGQSRLNTLEIDGQRVPVTGMLGKWMVHAPGRSIEPIMGRVETLYGRAMTPATSLPETTAAVAEIHYLLAHAMPYARGSASVTDALTKMIFQQRGISVSPWREGVVPDLEALTTLDRERFIRSYAGMMERAPVGPADGAP